jgi:glc operon protein GlcG
MDPRFESRPDSKFHTDRPVCPHAAGQNGPRIGIVGVMNSKPTLTAADARAVAAAAEAEATRQGWMVTIAVVDDGGHLLWLQRLEGAAPISAEIAPAKARTAALGRRESKVYEDMINQGRMSFLSAPVLQGMLEGGVPILVQGQCVGAVGVSGVKSSEDAQIARAGIAALGL